MLLKPRSSNPLILSIDSSGPFVAAALSHHPTSRKYEEVARGQAERLGPMCEEILVESGKTWSDLDAVAVGVGPGNFTGIRIAVSFARGIALGLKIPSVGVTAFEILKQGYGFSNRVLFSLPAPQGRAYVQPFLGDTALADPMMIVPGEVLLDMEQPGLSVCGFAAEQIAAPMFAKVEKPLDTRHSEMLAANIGLIAFRKLATNDAIERAKPLYVKPPDAAPPREKPPVILP